MVTRQVPPELLASCVLSSARVHPAALEGRPCFLRSSSRAHSVGLTLRPWSAPQGPRATLPRDSEQGHPVVHPGDRDPRPRGATCSLLTAHARVLEPRSPKLFLDTRPTLALPRRGLPVSVRTPRHPRPLPPADSLPRAALGLSSRQSRWHAEGSEVGTPWEGSAQGT